MKTKAWNRTDKLMTKFANVMGRMLRPMKVTGYGHSGILRLLTVNL